MSTLIRFALYIFGIFLAVGGVWIFIEIKHPGELPPERAALVFGLWFIAAVMLGLGAIIEVLRKNRIFFKKVEAMPSNFPTQPKQLGSKLLIGGA